MARALWVKVGAVVATALLLAGCMTPSAYAPRRPGETTGYTDRELAPGRWRVTFTGNSVTPRETVESYLLLRAAEVTRAAGGSGIFSSTPVTPRRPHQACMAALGVSRPGFYGGGFYGGWRAFVPRWGYSPFGPPA